MRVACRRNLTPCLILHSDIDSKHGPERALEAIHDVKFLSDS